MEACEPLSHAGRVGQSHRDARFRLRSDPCFSVRVWAGVPEQAVFFRLRLRLSLQNTTALPTPILSLNVVQRMGGSQRYDPTGNNPIRGTDLTIGFLLINPNRAVSTQSQSTFAAH